MLLGDVTLYDKAPTVTSHDKESICLYVNNLGSATINRGELKFFGDDSYGIRVNNGGVAKLYPNDLYGVENPTLAEPMIHIHGDVNTRAAMWVNEGGSFEIRGRGALLEQPYRDSGSGYALYISHLASGAVLAGGTFNGEIYYQFDGTTHRSIAGLIDVNCYVRYDGAAQNYGMTDGTYGILPSGTYTEADRLGDYVRFHGSANAFDESYQDKLGARGSYYSIIDAEWELRANLTAGGSYQLPTGIMDGSGAVTNTLTVDGGDPGNWAIGAQRGDVNVSADSTLYLAGGTLTYGAYADDGSNGVSLRVNGGTVSLAMDEAHKSCTDKATDQTSAKQHLNGVRVSAGTLYSGVQGSADAFNRNNGTLTAEGGTTYYYDGVTVGDTVVYGADNAADFGTKFYVEDGDFGAFTVENYNGGSTTYHVDLNEYVQLHGGYFQSIDNQATADAPTANVQSLIGVWAARNYDGSGDSWARFNHYVAEVTGSRDARGVWTRTTAIQSGEAKTAAGAITAGSGKAISVRSAADDFQTWATGAASSPFTLYANLWLDDAALCDAAYCDANYAPVTVTGGAHALALNGFGIFGEQTAALLDVASGATLTVTSASGTDAYADRIRNFGGDALSVSGGTLELTDAAVDSTATAITNAGTVTLNTGALTGATGIANTGTLDVKGGTITATGAGIETSGTANVTDGTISGGTNGVSQTDGALTVSGGAISGTTRGLNRTGAANDNKNFISGGTFSSVETGVSGEKLSDLLAQGKTFADNTGVEAGADVLNRGSIANGDNSGDNGAGGESVKLSGETITVCAYDAALAANFTVSDRTIVEIELTSANNNAKITVGDTNKASLQGGAEIRNATSYLYLVADGGSATATLTADANYCTGDVELNNAANSTLSHRSEAVSQALTAADSKLVLSAQACHIVESIESGITKDVTGNVYTLTGTNLAAPTAQKFVNGAWAAAGDVTIAQAAGGYTVTFPATLAADYKLTASLIHSTGGGGGGGGAVSAPEITVPVSGEAGKANVKVTVEKQTATVTEIDAKTVSGIAGSDAKADTVTVDVSDLTQKIDAVVLSTKTLKQIAENGDNALALQMETGTLTFNAGAVDTLATSKKESVTFYVDEVAASELTSEQQKTLKELVVLKIEDVYILAGTTRISEFGGEATVRVPCALKDDQDERGIAAWYLAEDGSKTKIPCSYENGFVVFTVPHFSNYVVAYDASRVQTKTDCPKDSTCPMSVFADLNLTSWYHDSIHFCLENGMMNGVSSDKLDPHGTTSRAMIVTILYRLEGEPSVSAENPFNDAADGKWYTNAVIWAAENGIVDGYRDGTFGPMDSITREQLASILYRYAQSKGRGFTDAWMFQLDYPDASEVSRWADEAMHWCVMQSIINGKDGKLVPRGDATRTEAATMLMRYCTKLAE